MKRWKLKNPAFFMWGVRHLALNEWLWTNAQKCDSWKCRRRFNLYYQTQPLGSPFSSAASLMAYETVWV